MLKMIKKTISLCLIAALLLSVMPVVSMASETSATLNYLNARTTRNGSNADKSLGDQGFVDSYGFMAVSGSSLTTGGNYNAYFQLDFTGKEDLLRDPASVLKFTFRMGAANSTRYSYHLRIYAVNDSADGYATDYPYVTYNQADPYGLHTVTNDQLVAEWSEQDKSLWTDGKPTSGVYSSNRTIEITTAGKNAILKALDSGDDQIVTFTVKSLKESWFGYSESLHQAHVSLTKLDDATYLEKIENELTWDAISGGQDKTNVTSNISLPLTYGGATVSWSSDDIVIPANGKLTLPKDADKTINLEATIEYNGLMSNPIAINDITLKKDELITETVNSSEIAQVAMYSPDVVIPGYNTSAGRYYVYYMSQHGINSTDGSRGDELVFMQWNLKDYAQKIEKAESIKIKIPSTTTNADNSPMGTNGVVTVLNDCSDNWTTADLTYNKAVEDGLYTDHGLGTVNEIDFVTDTDTTNTGVIDALISGDALTQGIKAAVAQNPDQGKVSFRFTSSDNNLCRIRPWTKTAALVEISYYGSEIDSAEEYAKSKADDITWDAVTCQDIDNVVADLTLPATWYGLPVSWQSTNSAIANDGTVTIGAAPATGKLLATIDGKTTEFTVTVPASNIALKSDRTYTEDEISYFNYSTGYIYANEAVAGPYTAILATYNANGELAGITVKDNTELIINAGKNILTPDKYNYAFAGGRTKVILVDNMTDLTPLAVAR